jgi:hypothetical protein
MSTAGPLVGAVRDLGVRTINVKKCQQWAPGGCYRRSGSGHHQHLETSTVAPRPPWGSVLIWDPKGVL